MELSPTSVLPPSKGQPFANDVDAVKRLEKEIVNLRLENYILLQKDGEPPAVDSQGKQIDPIRRFYEFDDDDYQEPPVVVSSSDPPTNDFERMSLEKIVQALEVRCREEACTMKKLQKENLALETNVDELLSRYRDDKVAAEKMLEENAALKARVEELERRAIEDNMNTNQLQEENGALNAKARNLETSEAALIRENYILVEELESKKGSAAILREEKAVLQQEVMNERMEFAAQLNFFKGQNKNLGEAISKMEAKIDGYILRQVETEVEITKYKAENLALKCDLDSLQKLKNENDALSEALLEEKIGRVDQLTNENAQLQLNGARMKEDLEILKAEHRAERNALLKEKGTLAMQIGGLKDEIEALNIEKRKGEEIEAAQLKEIMRLKQIPVSFVVSEGLASKFDALERDNKKLSIENTVLLRQTEYLSKSVTELQSRLGGLGRPKKAIA